MSPIQRRPANSNRRNREALQDHMAIDSHGSAAQGGCLVLQMIELGTAPVISERND